MNKKISYEEQLKDPRWQKKRLEILSRDNWTCMACGDTKSTLHVHHKWYSKGKNIWENEDYSLITLCEMCHKEEHETKEEYESILISTLYGRGLLAGDLLSLAAHISYMDIKVLLNVSGVTKKNSERIISSLENKKIK